MVKDRVRKKASPATIIGMFFFGATFLLFPFQEKKLESINKEIKGINNKLEKIKKDKKSLLNDIYELELRSEKEIIVTNKVKFLLTKTEGKISKKEGEKQDLELNIEGSKKNLKEIIRLLYKIGNNSKLKLFLQVNSIDQLFNNYNLFLRLINYKAAEITKIRENILSLNKVKNQLEEEYSRLQEYRQLKENSIRNMRNLRRGKLNLVKKINNDKKQFLQLLVELNYEAARINEVISGKKVKSSLKVINLQKIKGQLKWPIKGKIISSFGKKRSTRFNTFIINNGIEIQPSNTDKVKAVYSGDVVFADYFKGYGKLIILQHSRDLHSLYGHCEKILKKRGDSIAEGELIAIAGDTGSTLGKSLYFELRNKLKPQNPINWLGKRPR